MFDIGLGELVVIAVVGLLVFGPDRLPEMARQAGSWVRDVQRMISSTRREMSDSLGVDPRYLADPKGALRSDVLGDDLPIPPTSRDAVKRSVSKGLGLDEAAQALDIDPVDPDAT